MCFMKGYINMLKNSKFTKYHTKYYTNKQYLLNYETVRVCYKRFQLVIFISTRLIDSLQHPNS